MTRFAQHTKLTATRGNADKLEAKFIEAVDIQRDNELCELMLVGRSPSDENVVYLTEVWSSEAEWEKARNSPAIATWAGEMPALVGEPPESTQILNISGKGLQ